MDVALARALAASYADIAAHYTAHVGRVAADADATQSDELARTYSTISAQYALFAHRLQPTPPPATSGAPATPSGLSVNVTVNPAGKVRIDASVDRVPGAAEYLWDFLGDTLDAEITRVPAVTVTRDLSPRLYELQVLARNVDGHSGVATHVVDWPFVPEVPTKPDDPVVEPALDADEFDEPVLVEDTAEH